MMSIIPIILVIWCAGMLLCAFLFTHSMQPWQGVLWPVALPYLAIMWIAERMRAAAEARRQP